MNSEKGTNEGGRKERIGKRKNKRIHEKKTERKERKIRKKTREGK